MKAATIASGIALTLCIGTGVVGRRNLDVSPFGPALPLVVGRDARVLAQNERVGQWRSLRLVLSQTEASLSDSTMRSLGFRPPRFERTNPLPRGGYVVLALREPDPTDSGVSASRLTVIAGGAEPAALVARYGDGRRYLITRAVIRAVVDSSGLGGWVDALLPGLLHVPRDVDIGDTVRVMAGRGFHPMIARPAGR